MSHPEIEAVLRGASRWAVIEGDNADYRATFPKSAAIVSDPPYGIGAAKMNLGFSRTSRMEKMEWDDNTPDLAPWLEFDGPALFWGGNYFPLPPSRGFLVWDKGAGFAGRDFAECEMAWTSKNASARLFTYNPLAFSDGRKKEHPTQKPVPVMVWCISYLDLPPDSLIVDPFCGSGTTGIAAANLGHRFIGIEREASYCAIARRRITDAVVQGSLFNA